VSTTITPSVPSTGPAPAGYPVERRRSTREKKDLPAWLSAAAGSRSESGFNVTVLDLSLHGAGLLIDKPLTIGATHWMVVSGKSLRLSTRLQIVSCRPNADGIGYICGAEFF
jgi:hypothetical protein